VEYFGLMISDNNIFLWKRSLLPIKFIGPHNIKSDGQFYPNLREFCEKSWDENIGWGLLVVGGLCEYRLLSESLRFIECVRIAYGSSKSASKSEYLGE
jgi:hypothetical protein